jgi:hypothetical protein
MVILNDVSVTRPPQLYVDLQAACTDFKNRFATTVLGGNKDAVVDIAPIFDPDFFQNVATEISPQLVHRDSTVFNTVNFLIPLTENYLVRFFEEDDKTAMLVAPSSLEYCMFSREGHQGMLHIMCE